jgi:hypothetical protein
MKNHFYLILTLVGLVLVLIVVLFASLNSSNDLTFSVYNRKAVVTDKYFDQNYSCYIVNCTGNLLEIKDGVYQKNCQQTFDGILVNQEYIFSVSYDTQNNLWNIINATSAAK